MKLNQKISLIAAFLLVLPVLAQAELYKWKDKNGVIQYTDKPPPTNVKQEPFGRKKASTPTGAAPLSAVVTAPAQGKAVAGKPDAKQMADAKGNAKDKPNETAEEAAKKRQQDAEADKKAKAEKEAEAKRKTENCSAAKANMQSYVQGGRVYKMTEKGEREYLDEKAFAEGRAKAQQEIDENCS